MAILFGDANDFGLLRGIQRGGCGRIGEDDIETLAFPVTGARDDKKQAKARDVNALAHFLERLRAIHAAHMDLRGNFGALAAAAIGGDLMTGGGRRIRFSLCGGDWRSAHEMTSDFRQAVCVPQDVVTVFPL